MSRQLPELYEARFDEREVSAKDAVWREIVRFLQRYVDRSAPVLDVACDRGHFIRFAFAKIVRLNFDQQSVAATPSPVHFPRRAPLNSQSPSANRGCAQRGDEHVPHCPTVDW